MSRKIATAEANEEFAVSHARLIQIENDESTPSIYKLFTLSAIYGRSFTGLVSFYLELANLAHHSLDLEIAATRPIDLEAYDGNRPVTFPVRFDPAFQPGKTSLLSRVVEVWGEIPAALLESLRVRKLRYGLIGLEDFTMYPLLRPGSFVQIDDQQKPQVHVPYRSEHERPIWFLELRTGYICSWCEVRRESLVSIPHPLSPCRTREFAYPNEVEIVGRVTAVAARIVSAPEPVVHPASKLQARS